MKMVIVFIPLASLARRLRGGSEAEGRAAETGETETGETGCPSVAVLMLPNVKQRSCVISGIMIIYLYKQSEVNLMSHPVNDEILENIYDNLLDELGTIEVEKWTHDQLEAEVMKRFEEMG